MKPYKEFYELLWKKLWLSMEEILLVDDAEENIQWAKNLGYTTLLYQRWKSLSESIISFLQTINYL